MATPLTADAIVHALTSEGVHVVEYKNWRTHNRDGATGKTFGPVSGIVIHHTAGRDSLALCYNGRSDLPGPLCHTHLAKDGTATMVGHGRVNHAGTFAQNAVDAMVHESHTHPHPDATEPVDANDLCYGIEIENLGDGHDPYPAVQYEAAVKWAAALCRAHGWTADSVIGHKEGTRRKTDPSFDMNTFRADVAKHLAPPTKPPVTPPTKPPVTPPTKPPVTPPTKPPVAKVVVDLSNVIRAFHDYPRNPSSSSVKAIQHALAARNLYTGKVDGLAGKSTRAAYAAYQRSLHYTGSAADGIPGKTSLTKLGSASGLFTVKA